MDSILKTGFGWISPKGEEIPCRAHNHLQVIQEWSRIEEYITDLPERKKQLDEYYEGHLALEKREGSCNAEWHNYEIECDNFADRLIQSLYDAGFIRIAILRGAKTIAFEGTNEHLIAKGDRLRRIANQLCTETGTQLQTELKPRYSTIRLNSIEAERKNVSRDSIQAVQNFIRKPRRGSTEIPPNLYVAMVPEFVTTEGRLTSAGKLIIDQWKAQRASTN